MSKPFYITTTLPYVNAKPHVGFAMELIRADVIARSKMLRGYDVFFNTGTDEHGQKLWEAAQKEGKDVQLYVDEYAEQFRDLKGLLGVVDAVHFVRTTDPHHVSAAQEFWKRCKENGFIYKKTYQTKYCIGCELEKTDSELSEEGECPIHPGRPVQLIDEENYFFQFSAFQDHLLEFYEQTPDFVIPDFRFNEIKSFVSAGLEDFSISRLKAKMSWGVSVPGDDDHVMYVWFDALVNYISTLGWPGDQAHFERYWVDGTPTQYCGKDNLRQQSAMWQAMLMAADLPKSRQIIINGFITAEGGVKMSKSIGNVLDPYDIVSEYGTEALRSFLLKEISNFEDSPFTMERFKNAYNADLANGLGNLTSRILTLSEKHLEGTPEIPEMPGGSIPDLFFDYLDNFEISRAMEYVWSEIGALDRSIQETEPFKVIKINPELGKMLISDLVVKLYGIACMLECVLPESSRKIKEYIAENKKPTEPLFLRKE